MDVNIKTRQSELLKLFPDTITDCNGVINLCPRVFGHTFMKEEIPCDGFCEKCRKAFWLRRVK